MTGQNAKYFTTIIIVFVWSQFDGGKIDNRTIGLWFPSKSQKKPAEEYYGRRLILDPNIQDLDPTIHFIT